MPETNSTNCEKRWCTPSPDGRRRSLGLSPPRRRLALLGAVTLAALGAMLGVASWLTLAPEVRFVPCWMAEFHSPQLPPNTAAENDRLALVGAELLPEAGHVAVAGESRHQVLQALAGLSEPDAPEAVLVYLSGYAAVDARGRVFVLPGDAEPADAQSRLLLGEVLVKLRDCPAEHKLLVLDICWPLDDPRLGLLADDVAAHIPKALEKVPDNTRLVLLPCSPGQTALVCDELGRSVFGYYFQQALQGAADGYGPDRSRDGRIRVAELAAMVRARVGRWAEHNRGLPQTPRLLGSGNDFELRAVAARQLAAPPPLPQSLPYPAWITEGWAMRDRWWDEQIYRIDPRLFAELEAVLLRAERQWSVGGDAARIYRNLTSDLAIMKRRRRECEALLKRPAPRSLARLVESGHTIDPKLVDALETLLGQLEKQAASQPPDKAAAAREAALAKFAKDKKDRSADDVALAVYHVAMAEAPCRPLVLRTLDDLLSRWQPRPFYVETLLLRRLRQQADRVPPEAWPGDTAHRALYCAWLAEQAAADSLSLSWLLPALDRAATLRHEAELIFFARGYVPGSVADTRFHQAIEHLERLAEHRKLLHEALACRDRAMTRLPAYGPYLNHAPELHQHWLDTVRVASQLADALEDPPGPKAAEVSTDDTILGDLLAQPSPSGTGSKAASLASEQPAARASANDRAKQDGRLVERLEHIRRLTEDLRAKAEELRQPLTTPNLKRLLARSRRSEATGEVYREIQAVLATPLPSTSQRIVLWEAGRELSRRLHRDIAARDESDQQLNRPTNYTSQVELDSATAAKSRRAVRRAEQSVALLELAGLDATRCRRLLSGRAEDQPTGDAPQANQGSPAEAADRSTGKADAAELRLLSAAIREAWTDALAQAYRKADSPLLRRRLSWVVSPWRPLAHLDDPKTNPAVGVRRLQRKAHCAWLADYYRYRARDQYEPGFYWEVAGAYLHFAGGLPERYFEILVPEQAPQLDATQRTADCRVSWRGVGWSEKPPPVKLNVLPPADPRLKVTPELDPPEAPRPPQRATFRIAFSPSGSAGAETQPDGFIVRLEAAGRSYHRRVTLPSLPTASGLKVLLSENSKKPEPALEALCLRPTGTPRSFYLYLRNESAEAHQVNVQLKAGAQFESPLKIGPNQTLPVVFKGKPPAAKSPLPDLAGPLAVRVVEAESHEELVRETFAVRVLRPREYVEVDSIQFTPATSKQPKNRLEVELRGAGLPPGGPCSIELALPVDRFQGLLGVGGGALRGKLPPDGKPLILHADKLRLAPGAAQGDVYLNVDGFARAFVFWATLPQYGDPTTPREDLRPALRIDAPRYAKAGPGFQVEIPVDNAPAGARLQVQLGQSHGKEFAAQLAQTLPGGRHTRVGLSPFGPNGALMASGSVDDWKIDLDTTGMIGARQLRVTMLDQQGRTLQAATKEVVFEAGPPSGSRFVDLPETAPEGKPLEVTVAAGPCPSGIDKVELVLAKPIDGKLPPGAKLIEAKSSTDHEWVATLELPKAGDEPLEVSARLTSRVGFSEWITAKLPVGPADVVEAGSIQGTVVVGSLPQPGLEVVLQDAKGAVKAKTTTGSDGSFRFEAVKPGKYTAASSKPVSGRKGSAPVSVPPGGEVKATIALWL